MRTPRVKTQDWCDLARAARYHSGWFAKVSGLSLRQLERRCHERRVCAPHVWLEVMRMQEAVRLLAAGGLVKTVATDLGFRHPSHLIRVFKRAHGFTPTEFIRRAGRLPDAITNGSSSSRSDVPSFVCPYAGSKLCTGWCVARLGCSVSLRPGAAC
ncbi:MAG TPA: AraC family transcriptional regulator [Verrucomicrobiae bacterium]